MTPTTPKRKLPPGIRIRHVRACPEPKGGRCTCRPVIYESWVWDKREERKVYKRFESLAEAKGWRADTVGAESVAGLVFLI